jgi:hypothetical protein
MTQSGCEVPALSPRPLQQERAVFEAEAGWVEIAVELPLQAELRAIEAVIERQPRLRSGPLRPALRHARPAISGPLDGLDERATAQGAVMRAMTVQDAPPLTAGTFDEVAVALGPPCFSAAVGVDERVVGRVLPRAERMAGACRDDHVRGGRAEGAALRGEHVIPLTVPFDARTLQALALDGPIRRDGPGIMHLALFTGHMRAVGAEFGDLAGGEEQEAFPGIVRDVADVECLCAFDLARF